MGAWSWHSETVPNPMCDPWRGFALPVPQFPHSWNDQFLTLTSQSLSSSVPQATYLGGRELRNIPTSLIQEERGAEEFSLTNDFLFIGKKSCNGDKLLTKQRRRFCWEQILILCGGLCL